MIMNSALQFNCVICPEKFESDEQLYPHYLFIHGIYKQTCSTDIALKQFEKQQELSSRYELLRSELLKVIRFIKHGRYSPHFGNLSGQVTQSYDERKHYFLTEEIKILLKELDTLNAIYRKIPQSSFYIEYKTFDSSKPYHCQKCLRGIHDLRKDQTIRSCKKEIHITYGGKGYRFHCACDCNNSIPKPQKCPFCDLLTQQGPLTSHLIHSFKKNLKWN